VSQRRPLECFEKFMPDLTYMDPPIEVAATGVRFKIVAARLRSGGMRPYASGDAVDFDASDPLLIDLASVSKAVLETCHKACLRGLTRRLIILDTADAGLFLSDALTVRRDRDLGMLKGRLSAMARREARSMEVAIRAETAQAFGIVASVASPDEAPELLYLGQSSPIFLSLENALRAGGVSVTAALSCNMASDYLSTRRFSAALVDMTSASECSALLSGGSGPGEMLNGLPILALVDGDNRPPDDAQDLLSHADEIIECQDPEPDVVKRIAFLARKYQALRPARPMASITRGVGDDMTGLYSSAFLAAHLERQIDVANQRADALSVMTLKLVGEHRSDVRLLDRLATCLGPLLRETDCAAVVETGTIAVSMPLTSYHGAVQLSKRIAEAIAEVDELASLTLNWRVVEKRNFHTAKALLEAALSGPFMRLDAA
jgi:two-component system cell cycle response regulator PopA